MILNTVSYNEFVQLADIIWQKKLDSLPNTMRNSGLVKVDKWLDHTGESKLYSEVDSEIYAHRKSEGDSAHQTRVQVGYQKYAYLARYGEDLPITVEMRKRNKYVEVIQRLTDLASKVPDRLDLDLSHRLTFGAATSYVDLDGVTVDTTVGDTLALFSTAHTLKASSTTYRNILAGNPQISRGALEGIEQLVVEQTFNQFGEKMTTPFDILWTTDDPNTCNTVAEILKSTAEPAAPNAGVVNPYQGRYRHVKLPRVATTATGAVDSTKAKYWGIASSYDSTFMLGIHEEPFQNNPTSGNNAEDVSTEDWVFTTRGSYAICIVSGRWIKMSKGDGTA